MSVRRRIVAVAAAAALSVTAIAAVSATAASAATAATTATTATAAASGPTSTTTAGAHTYTFSAATGSTSPGTGTMSWNNTTWALSLTATTGALAAGSCVTVYFDWRSIGHHDARALRDCRSNDTYTYAFPDANTSNLVGGPSRMGVCYGTDNTPGTCSYYSVSSSPYVQMDWTVWPQPTWTYPCVLSWARRGADGTLSSFIDAHPQRRLLQGATC